MIIGKVLKIVNTVLAEIKITLFLVMFELAKNETGSANAAPTKLPKKVQLGNF